MVLELMALILVFQQVTSQDVCYNYETLPNAWQRYYYYHVNNVIVHDFYLKPGWYRAGDEIMPTEKPKSIYICGTKYPIWMNGTHPTVQDGIVHRVACAVGVRSLCSIKYNIKVKNCGTFSVYFLTNTTSRQEAYCFGIGTAGKLPTFVPPEPVVSPIEVVKQGYFDVYSRVHFVCKFETSTDPLDAGLYYQVYWYATKDGSEAMYVMSEQPKENLDDLQLTEEIFMNNMKQSLGVEISCAVLPLSGKKGVPGRLSQRSNPFFAGVQVNVIRSKMIRGDNANPGKASVTSTIPIGCDGRSACVLAILAYVPEKEKCTGPSFGNYCGTQIFSNRWNSSYYINIVAGNDVAYALSGSFDIHLKTERFVTQRIWNNYYLPKFSVEIANPPFKDWPGKICYLHNTGHMKTFDGRLFENHIAGEFILYRHLSFTAEVQIKRISCEEHLPKYLGCNCGVAVKAGMDVFVLDLCGSLPFIGYKDGLCGDSTLDVRKTGNTYRIYLPYGTYVTVLTHNGRFVNVDVTPSVHDQDMMSTGLCGALSGVCTDDFRKRDGTFPQYVNSNCDASAYLEPYAVIAEWRVWKNESLFALTSDVRASLIPWVTYECACDSNFKSTIDNSIPCGGHTTQSCHVGAKVGTKTCQILKQRKRRSVTNVVRFPSPKERARRSVLSQLPEYVNMTEEEARNYCQNYIRKSPIFDLCNNVPTMKSEENINTCTMDIILTKKTAWSDSARESMREQCLNEISRNRETNEASTIVAEIKEKVCLSMCSNKGRCVNGTCICDSGYGSSDCSFDLRKPPEMFGLLDDGLCDERYVECNQAFVYGEIFAEGENLTCRIKPFIMSIGGIRKYDSTFYTPAMHETLFEVMCPVQQTRRKKRSYAINIISPDGFVIGYSISVSNDGQRFGKDFDLYLYNSECQLSQNESERFTFSLMDGYCFIDHVCVGNGQVHYNDKCLICDDKRLKYDWSARDNHEACRNLPDTSSPLD